MSHSTGRIEEELNITASRSSRSSPAFSSSFVTIRSLTLRNPLTLPLLWVLDMLHFTSSTNRGLVYKF